MALPAYVGRYQVRNEIAVGGFAVVAQAWDEELESFVALKILHGELAKNEEIQNRFLEEARLLRRVRAPNVVTVHDVGRLNDGRPYMVLDFADRGTLEPRLESLSDSSPPDYPRVMVLVDAIADGLTAIHEAGLVHRDIKPANILFQLMRRGPADTDPTLDGSSATSNLSLVETGERVLVGDLGIAKDVVNRGNLPTVVAGTPLFQAPEQMDANAEITPAADVYSATAVLWQILTGHKPPGVQALAERVQVLPADWQDVIRQGMALDPAARFPDMQGWREAVQDTLAQYATDSDTNVARKTRLEESCPYKGLASYQPEDARMFWGREALIDEVVRRVQLSQVLVVGGPSGSGKSSLVRAGLIPALRAGALADSQDWHVILFTPGRDPLAELHYQITKHTNPGAPAVSLEELLARPTLARHLAGSQERRECLLCIDQFEELFTLATTAQRNLFFTALSAMTDPADSKVRVVIVVRADFYGECAQIPWLAERITNNQVLVGPMSRAELRRAITEPARRAGLHLERGLVEAIIDETGDEAGSLPLVAHALVETWVRRQGNLLTMDGFQGAGGVAGAISQTADATYEHGFDAREREVTKRLFLRLVTPGEGTPDTRRLLPLTDIEQDSDPEVMQRVVERLTEARLLTVDDADVQIAHEALLRTWPRLRSWIEESRDDLRLRQRITRAATEWNDEGRDPDLLYRGTPLLSALEWVTENPDQLGALGRDFLDACAATRAREEAIEVERQRKARNIRRAAVAGLSFLAIGAMAASVVAFLAYRDAQRNEEMAERATMQAKERFASALGSAAYGHVDEDPMLALVLAAEAANRAGTEPPSYDTRAALVTGRQLLARGGVFLLGSPAPAGDAMAIAMSQDGSQLAIAQRSGDIDLLDTTTRRPVGAPLRGHVGGVRDLQFEPHGRWLASVGVDGTVRAWNLRDGSGRTLGKTGDVVMGVSVDPAGTMIASANGDGTAQLWDVASGAAVGEPLASLALGFRVIAFSTDAARLLAVYNDGTVYGWALPSREPLFDPIGGVLDSNPSDISVSPVGTLFATASTDGSSVIIDHADGRVVGLAFDQDNLVGTVVFTPQGDVVIGGGADGKLKLWDVNTRKLIGETARGHSQRIVDTELDRRGVLLVTLGHDQSIRFWTRSDAYPLAQERQVTGRRAKGIAYSPEGRYLAAGDDDGVVQVWDIAAGTDPLLLRDHQSEVWSVAFSPSGQLLASGDRSGRVHIRDVASGALRLTIAVDDSAIWSLAFSPNSEQLVVATDAQADLYDVSTGERLHGLTQGVGKLSRAALSADGTMLATAWADGRVQLWDMASNTLLKELAVDDDVIWSVAFSPDGTQLATASGDEIVALWDVATGRRQAMYVGHTGGAVDVAYLADGVTLLVSDRSGQLHWWDTQTDRRLVEPLPAHKAASWRLAVHPDGQTVATAGDDGRIKTWDLLSTERACQIGVAAFDAVRRSQYLGEGEKSVACDVE